MLPSISKIAQTLIRETIEPGSCAIDATVGNGHDTIFLAGRVGAKGTVLGFDRQEVALDRTRERLLDAGLMDRVKLVLDGHENVTRYIRASQTNPVTGCMFNLGYLPGADKAIISVPETTLKALELMSRIIVRGGVITVVTYTGHEGGLEEAEAVQRWAATLPSRKFTVLQLRYHNRTGGSPALTIIEKD